MITTSSRRCARRAAVAVALSVGLAASVVTPAAFADQPEGHVCIPQDGWCYDLNGGGGVPIGGGGEAGTGSDAGAGSGTAGGGYTAADGSTGWSPAPSGSGGGSNGSPGATPPFDQDLYDQCMARRDIVCDALGVVTTYETDNAGWGFAVRQGCRLAYKAACEYDANKP